MNTVAFVEKPISAPVAKRRHASSMPRVLAPDDWFGRHSAICIALVAVLLLLAASF